MSAERTDRPRRDAGFSLIEMLIAMVIAVQLLVAALTVFDVHNKMARVQMQITEVQQALRVAQFDISRVVRLAGRGTLSSTFTTFTGPGGGEWLRSAAIEVRNNLTDDADREVAFGFTDTPLVVEGTDMLTARGCMSGRLLLVNNQTVGDFQIDTGVPGTVDFGEVTLRKVRPDMRNQYLGEFLEPGFDDPIVIQSATSRGVYAVAEVTGVAGDLNAVTLTLDWTSNLVPPNPMVNLPDPDMSASFVCVLEEYRYYIRENFAVPGDDTSQILPRLSRARMIPGTELPYKNDIANLSLDVADQIFDLQIAMAFDTDWDVDGEGDGSTADPGAFIDDNDTLGADDVLYEGAADDTRDTDDWLFNSSLDDAHHVNFRVNRASTTRPPQLLNLRINTVARTLRPDPGFIAPDFDAVVGHDWIEDQDMDAAPNDVWKQGQNRNYRRRMLRTNIDFGSM
jgi:prepilin-type N-terminal cleavage/methylation domain-containing protein